MVDRFEEMAGGILCPVVSENIFATPEELAEYVAGGGCKETIKETSKIFMEACDRFKVPKKTDPIRTAG